MEWLAQCPEPPANVRVVGMAARTSGFFSVSGSPMRLASREQISPTSEEVFADLVAYAERLRTDMSWNPVSPRRALVPGCWLGISRDAPGQFLYLGMWARALHMLKTAETASVSTP